jgi:GMP synthase-like glutamine amidotransferase
MAQAFGGTVIKSPKGRGVGLHRYRLDGVRIGGLSSLAAPASHGDQVVELAPNSRVFGGNDFCPLGMIEYPFGAVSVQFHPEFEPAFAKALLTYEEGAADDPAIQAAERSLDRPNDNTVLGTWMAGYLRG